MAESLGEAHWLGICDGFNTVVCKDGVVEYPAYQERKKVEIVGECALKQLAVHHFPQAMVLVIVCTSQGYGFVIQQERAMKSLHSEELKCFVEIWHRWKQGGREQWNVVGRWKGSKFVPTANGR